MRADGSKAEAEVGAVRQVRGVRQFDRFEFGRGRPRFEGSSGSTRRRRPERERLTPLSHEPSALSRHSRSLKPAVSREPAFLKPEACSLKSALSPKP